MNATASSYRRSHTGGMEITRDKETSENLPGGQQPCFYLKIGK